MFARSVTRSALRASTRAAAPAVPKIGRATFVASAKLRKADPLIPQSEVPTSAYSGGEVSRSTISVGGAAAHPVEEVVTVTPLTEEMYKKMTPMMQKMSLFGKVIIITG